MRLGPQGTKPKNNKPRVYVTDGADIPLNGVCVFFLRANTAKAITEEVIHKVGLELLNSCV